MTLEEYQAKYQEIKDMLEDMYGYRKDELDFDLIARVLAKYYDDLTDYDIRQIINEIVDYYDTALTKGENYNIIKKIIHKYIPDIEGYSNLSKRDKLIMQKNHLEDLIDQIEIELANTIDPDYQKELKRELSRLKRELFNVKRELEAVVLEHNANLEKESTNYWQRMGITSIGFACSVALVFFASQYPELANVLSPMPLFLSTPGVNDIINEHLSGKKRKSEIKSRPTAIIAKLLQ